MGKTYEGSLVGTDLKIAIVAGRFNEFITSKLLDGATDRLKRHGVGEDNIDVAWMPGEFEIPLIAQKLATEKDYDAVITLGTAIRRSTSHYDYVCTEAAKRVSSASLKSGQPVIFGMVRKDKTKQPSEQTGELAE